ncbi:MAG: formylmethanofuran dehydrogenase subunit C [Candidatus Methanospirareceae archaeon]
MQIIRLKLKEDVVKSGEVRVPIEVDALTPDKVFGKKEEEIRGVKIWWGNKQEDTGYLFDVSVEGDAKSVEEVKIIFEGDMSRVKRIGEGMKGGEIEVRGDVGMHCGAMMRGGRIVVRGNADCWAGREMKGGELIIEGDADDYLCASYRGETVGMTGGRVEVGGDAGDYVGQYMKGGEIVIKGNAGLLAGLNMNGGRIIIGGNAILPGGSMTNGEIVIKGEVTEALPSFRYEGTETVEGEEYKKYVGDLTMGKKAKGVIYMR